MCKGTRNRRPPPRDRQENRSVLSTENPKSSRRRESSLKSFGKGFWGAMLRRDGSKVLGRRRLQKQSESCSSAEQTLKNMQRKASKTHRGHASIRLRGNILEDQNTVRLLQFIPRWRFVYVYALASHLLWLCGGSGRTAACRRGGASNRRVEAGLGGAARCSFCNRPRRVLLSIKGHRRPTKLWKTQAEFVRTYRDETWLHV